MPAPPKDPVIAMRGVAKVFRSAGIENHVLTDIHLEVRQGEFLAVAGPSGCGKTTLLSLMGLLDVATEGSLVFEGAAVEGLGRAARARLRNQRIGYVFQAFNLIGDLDVFDNVALPLTYRTSMGREERRRRVLEALDDVGMTHRMHHFPSQLSGGQQQQVAVARALAGSPAILLADEPTGSLDLASGERIMTLLGRLHGEGRTICMVTHEERFRWAADRTVRLLDGRVVDESSYAQWRREEASGLDDRRLAEPFT
ncbi:ABC transporter ATP-binding protein [Xanthomonas sp. NCPPB 2632]|uniref:ABC transporter ATP-binding protein n=1 Tax=Xanthomonas sp. NCPPB 2632 TaxID=3240912 RepID=UPI0035129070